MKTLKIRKGTKPMSKPSDYLKVMKAYDYVIVCKNTSQRFRNASYSLKVKLKISKLNGNKFQVMKVGS